MENTIENFSIPIRCHFPPEFLDSFCNEAIARINQALDARLDAITSTPVKLSRQEVCTMLKISLPTLNAYERQGFIQGEKIGRRKLFDARKIEAFLQNSNRL